MPGKQQPQLRCTSLETSGELGACSVSPPLFPSLGHTPWVSSPVWTPSASEDKGQAQMFPAQAWALSGCRELSLAAEL